MAKVIYEIGGFRKEDDILNPPPRIKIFVPRPLNYACRNEVTPSGLAGGTVLLRACGEENGAIIYRP